MVITYKLKLYPPNTDKRLLLTITALKQTECVNYWVDKIRELGHINLTVLQRNYYYEARKKYGLSGVLTQCAEFTAIRIARTSKKKRTDCPYLKTDLITTNNIRIDENNLGVAFGEGYIWFPFKGRELPEGKIRESKIKQVGNDWYCFLTINIEQPKIKGYRRVMGVDMGLAKIATLSDWNGNNTKFFRGESLRKKRQHYYNLRKKLQPKIKQGNVYKLLKRISEKESNWMRSKNHEISRQIINIAIENKRAIAIENLSGIRERIKGTKKTRRMLHGWSFRQLADFITYKARLAGLPDVLAVDPRETSRKCPKCQYVSRSNRKSQERFKCNECRYESNADRVGAMNIAQRATGLLASR